MTIEALWLICGLVLIMLEMLLPGFIIFFFGLGAFITAGLVWLMPEVSFVGQGICFSVASIVTLVLGRLCFRKALSGKVVETAVDADESGILGATAEVVEAITPPRTGRVAIHGVNWNAVAKREIAVGKTVTVVARDNITLTVE